MMQTSHSPHRQGRPPNNRREAALGTASEMEEVTSDSPPKVIERIHASAEELLALQPEVLRLRAFSQDLADLTSEASEVRLQRRWPWIRPTNIPDPT
jgi:hypothetical protein